MFLHKLAIRYGWYKMLTTGQHLNIGRTIFGQYFFEGEYIPKDLSILIDSLIGMEHDYYIKELYEEE